MPPKYRINEISFSARPDYSLPKGKIHKPVSGTASSFSSIGLSAVSYTHLDVYKRQAYLHLLGYLNCYYKIL